MTKRTLTLSVLAASLMLAGTSFAVEKKKDAMMNDSMKKETMIKSDDMKKDDMMKDGMKKDAMMKSDGMTKDAMMKDGMKKDKMMKKN